MGGQNTSVGAAVYQAVSPTIYTPEVYPSYYDSGYCLNQNVTYSHRVDVPGASLVLQRTAAVAPVLLVWGVLAAPPSACHPCQLRPFPSLAAAADNFNYCSTPLTGQDAFLFTSIALLVAAFCMGKLSAIWMLVAGKRGGGRPCVWGVACTGKTRQQQLVSSAQTSLFIWLIGTPPCHVPWLQAALQGC